VKASPPETARKERGRDQEYRDLAEQTLERRRRRRMLLE
jgi:hypothetical protein